MPVCQFYENYVAYHLSLDLPMYTINPTPPLFLFYQNYQQSYNLYSHTFLSLLHILIIISSKYSVNNSRYSKA